MQSLQIVFPACMVELCRSGYSSLVLGGRRRHHLASQVLESEVNLLVLWRIGHSRKGISVVIVRPLGRLLAMV